MILFTVNCFICFAMLEKSEIEDNNPAYLGICYTIYVS